VAISILREEYGKAAEYGERAYRLEPADPVVAGNLAWTYHNAGDAKKRDETMKVAEAPGYPNVEALKEVAAE